jgi:inositol hexakisphosphate/diphosphoinositol-pentakisphosphate kinase
MYKRWVKLLKDLYDSKKPLKPFVQSKIPDIYDSILYDVKNNRKILEKLYPNYNKLLELAQTLAFFVVPIEYGIEKHTRLKTAELIVTPLCKKILNDLMFWKGNKFHEEEQYWKYKLG